MKRISRITIILVAGVVLGAGPGFAGNYDPHPEGITYRENFRGQFHFSPASEWMNDVNALMYHDGKYHMIYQWGKKIRHGGYATSMDLLHWTDEGVALVPQDTFLPKEAVNVSGSQVYSGSGVVVSGDVAEKITGSRKEAMVAIYTGTKCGTCLAWSNDGGRSWHDYKANPVANPTRGTSPRDPCVFLYEPTETWILAIYQGGTTFYGSKDLITWERLSNFKFGYECPDVFELPLDGDQKNRKWVLQDANGAYLVGQFDGRQFIKEQDPLLMDNGRDFYAAQTFFRPNLPDGALVQIAWNDCWNGGVGEKGWERNATFPVVVGLVTHDGKMRITRTPIKAIEGLYKGRATTFSGATLREGENLLKDIKSKTFDMTAVFDLRGTAAKSIDFRIAQVKFQYDIAKQRMGVGLPGGKVHRVPGVSKDLTLKPDEDGLLTIRMLVDWAQLEIFSAGGVFSASYHLGFAPDNSGLGLSATGGEVKLRSLTLNEVARIWPAAPRTEKNDNSQ